MVSAKAEDCQFIEYMLSQFLFHFDMLRWCMHSSLRSRPIKRRGWGEEEENSWKKKTEEWISLRHPPPLYTPAMQTTCTVVSGDPLNIKSWSFRQNLVCLPNSMQISADFNIGRNNKYARPFNNRYLNGHDLTP